MAQNNKKTLKMLSNTIDFPLIEWYTLYCQEGDQKTIAGQAGKGGNMEVMGMTDNQWKDNLRSQLEDWEEVEELLQEKKIDEALKKIQKVKTRINKGLED